VFEPCAFTGNHLAYGRHRTVSTPHALMSRPWGYMKSYSAARVIFTAGLICGFLDGLSAMAIAAYSGVGPMRVFQGIASGLLGRSSFQGVSARRCLAS
jgi:hypothetical protein